MPSKKRLKIKKKAVQKKARSLRTLQKKTKGARPPKRREMKRQQVVPKEPPPIPPSEQQVWQLLDKARGRGFSTEQEILAVFPRVELYLSLYESFLDVLDVSGVSVVEMREGFLSRPTEDKKILSAFTGVQPDMDGSFD